MSLSPQEQEKIYQEEKARQQARKRLKKEENRRKNKNVLIGLGIFFLVAMFIGILSSGKRTGTDATSSSPTLNKGQVELIDKLQREGYLRVEHEYNKAYIARSLWNGMDAKTKEDFSVGLAVYCGAKKGTNINWVEIYDKQSAKKLAKYGSWGFEVY